MTTPPEPLGGFEFPDREPELIHMPLGPLIVEKWFKVSPEGGIEFHGFDSSEVIQILSAMSTLNADAVRYRPE